MLTSTGSPISSDWTLRSAQPSSLSAPNCLKMPPGRDFINYVHLKPVFLKRNFTSIYLSKNS